ncbi:uncharacterized protein LOC124355799 [Homalodisca vitripennis]|uniref:uncharacterized protein LOC124355799 n=1 Tax=Homalodisca vitripennis TaxID=197043 RepID=UPI001EE9D170|nr:uncharacterized protein LOC124355799 [Homalodisca vitripennis]
MAVSALAYYGYWRVKQACLDPRTTMLGDASSLKGLRLAIPEAVRSGEMVRLACNYDLEGAFLYSIKWYREDEEFYRYLPKEAPPTRVFPLPGVHVDVSTSDERIVTLLNVDRRSTGTFKCEVSADAPLFHTEIQSAMLRVVDVPVGEPEIATEKLRYASGEQIHVNCTAPPSHPAVNITWYLNNHQEKAEYTVATLGGLEQALSVLSLEADTGKLSLRCEATMYHLYHGVSELELWQDSPRPASVLGPSHNGGARHIHGRGHHLTVTLLSLVFLATR